MATLCHNCGDCHLPRPCPNPLNFCEICNNFGHTYTFCPQSVRHKEPNYQYWMLCHNCDIWHLPEPCRFTLYKCIQCGHSGHKEYFCPVNPISRDAYQELHNAQAGVKRKRTSDSTVSERSDSAVAIDPHRAEYVRLIRAEVAREVLHLHDQGYASDEILRHIARVPLQASYGINAFPTDQANQAPGTVTPAASVKSSLLPPLTPSSTGVYASQHERFSSGELAKDLSSKYQTLPGSGTSAMTVANTPVAKIPAPRKKRANEACPNCKGSKRRCDHKEEPTMNAPSGYKAADDFQVTSQGYDSNMQLNQLIANALNTPTFTGEAVERSRAATIAADNTPAQDVDKGSLHHLLNGPQDGAPLQVAQGDPGSKTYFTYSGVRSNSTENTDQAKANEFISPFGQTEGTILSSMSAQQPEPVSASSEAQGYVSLPNLAQITNSGETTTTAEAPKTGEMPSGQTVAAEKPKKGRGRPKRKT